MSGRRPLLIFTTSDLRRWWLETCEVVLVGPTPGSRRSRAASCLLRAHHARWGFALFQRHIAFAGRLDGNHSPQGVRDGAGTLPERGGVVGAPGSRGDWWWGRRRQRTTAAQPARHRRRSRGADRFTQPVEERPRKSEERMSAVEPIESNDVVPPTLLTVEEWPPWRVQRQRRSDHVHGRGDGTTHPWSALTVLNTNQLPTGNRPRRDRPASEDLVDSELAIVRTCDVAIVVATRDDSADLRHRSTVPPGGCRHIWVECADVAWPVSRRFTARAAWVRFQRVEPQAVTGRGPRRLPQLSSSRAVPRRTCWRVWRAASG